MSTYLIVIGKTSTGYSAHCPDVLGCAAVGKTVEKVVGDMKKAMELHFEGMAEDGDPLPKPGGVESYRDVMKDLNLDQYILAHVQIDTSRFAAMTSQPVDNTANGALGTTMDRESWLRFIEKTAGSITDPTFERHPQGELENRDVVAGGDRHDAGSDGSGPTV